MPELPEVEAVCRIAARALAGRRVVSVYVSRRRVCAPQTPRQFARSLEGRRFTGVERRGKNILLYFEDAVLWVHLRMTGNLYSIADARLRAATCSAHLVLDDGRALVFDDTRGLGLMRAARAAQISKLLGAIGIDPLSAEFTPERLSRIAGASRAAVKLLLMDQRRIAGIGNIYAAEGLHRAGIDPRRVAGTLSRARLTRLHAAIVSVLREGLNSAMAAYKRPGGFSEAEDFLVAVYGREGEPCRRCGRLIRRIPQGGRSTYFCAGCQR